MKQCLLVTVLAAFVLCTVASRAPAAELTDDQRAKILLRALTYDRNLATRAHAGKVAIRILFAPGDKQSVAEKDAIKKAFAGLGDTKISGFGLAVTEVPFSDAAALKANLGQSPVGAVYVCGGLQGDLAAILKVIREAKVASLAGIEALARAGVSVAVFDKAGKGQIIVNLPSSKKEGLDFDAALLRLADVIK
jgi:hypothetical protein